MREQFDNVPTPPNPDTQSLLVDAMVIAQGYHVPLDVHHVFLALLHRDSFTRGVFSTRSTHDLQQIIETVKACIPKTYVYTPETNQPLAPALQNVLGNASRFAQAEGATVYQPRHILKAIINQTPANYYVHLAVSRSMDLSRLPHDFARKEREQGRR